MSDVSISGTDRKTGKVTRLLSDYGFISADDAPDQDLYFKMSWFRESPPLKEGEAVAFDVKVYGTNRQAHHITRYPERTPGGTSQVRAKSRLPVTGHLFEWAYLGYLPNVLAELKGLALNERWEFQNAPRDPERPLPILFGYLFHTFQRLVLEHKVMVNEKASLAAFNTGLVDSRYETIHALFTPND